MNKLLAMSLLSLALFACEKEKPAATPTTAPAPSAAPESMTAAPAATPEAAGALKDCSCPAAPTEACHPNCPPITWKSADCDSAAGRPKACGTPAKH